MDSNDKIVLKRKVYESMIEWRDNWSDKYALFLRGARRVGKSTLAEKLGREKFKSFIMIDFRSAPIEIKQLLKNSLNQLDYFFSAIQSFYNTILYPHESLIIFDEIQLFPLARQAITLLVKDGRYSYLETGSLASINSSSSDIVLPSEEHKINVYPLDFEEFLWCMEDFNTFDFIRNSFDSTTALGAATHRRILNLWRQYLLVGGMPQAVVEFIKTNNYEKVDFIKQKILDLYRDDVSGQKEENPRYIQSIIDVIPSELSKHDKRFVVSHVDKNARYERYTGAFKWLSESFICNFAFKTNDPSVALALDVKDSSFKCYMGDTGLLVSLAYRGKNYIENDLYNSILFKKLHVNEGMIIENAVAQAFISSGKNLFFYTEVDEKTRKQKLEIDFLISKSNSLYSIEIKSGKHHEIESLIKFKAKYKKKIRGIYVLWDKDVQIDGDIIYLPLYMASLL